MPGNFKVAFELLLIGGDFNVTQIRLLNEDDLVTIASNDISCFLMSTILNNDFILI